LVKALAAGALLAAAALPMAIASSAGAATAPTITGAFVTGSDLAGSSTITSSTTSPTITITATSGTAYAAGDLVTSGNTVIGTLSANVASAATSETGTLVANATTAESAAPVEIYVPIAFGEGAYLGTGLPITVLGTGFAFDGGNASIVSSDKDLSITNVTEVTGKTSLTADVKSTIPGTTFGSQSITLTDDNGTSNALAGAITVNADPTVSALTPVTVANDQATGLLTVTGSFVGSAGSVAFSPTTGVVTGSITATLTDVANGTTLEVNPTSTYSAGSQGYVTSATGTSVTFYAWAINSTNGLPATPGAYSLTIQNADGGTVTSVSDFTVTAAGIQNISPSAISIATTSAALTINGNGFEPLATVALSGTTCLTEASIVGTPVVVTPSQIAFNVDVTSITTPTQCTVTVTNPSSPGNGAVFVSTDGLGIAEAGFANATVTAAATTPAGAIAPGSTTTTPVSLTVTGTGFSPYSTVTVLTGTGTTTATGVSATPCVSSINGDTLTCTVAVGTLAQASTDGIEVLSGLSGSIGSSGAFEGALSVSGPAITSSSPTALAVGAPEGTVITFTGTGFNSTATAVATGSGLISSDYVFAPLSATSATLTLTAPLPVGSNSISVVLTETVSTGIQVSAAPFTIKVDPRPTVTGLVNTATKVDGVGEGSVGTSVTITGTGFQTGATITKFVSAYGVADTGASGTVVSVNAAGTQLVADITLPAVDANIADGYTITNPDGGTASGTAFTVTGLTIDAGPTITSVTPASGAAGSTTSFAVVGTGFLTGAVGTLSPANGTCGTATVTASTTLAVTCTLSQPSSVATYLVITNPDGGSATSTTAVLAALTPPKVAAFHVSGVHGAAIAGKTVVITISGTGFYGQPKITSSAAGSKFGVTKDNGRLLTVRVTTKAGVHGEHVLTVRLANGKSGKAGYNIKA
jgi:hypothetical protein